MWQVLGLAAMALWALVAISDRYFWSGLGVFSLLSSVFVTLGFFAALIFEPVKTTRLEYTHDQFVCAQNGGTTSVVLHNGRTFSSDKAYFYNEVTNPKNKIVEQISFSPVGLEVNREYSVEREQ